MMNKFVNFYQHREGAFQKHFATLASQKEENNLKVSDTAEETGAGDDAQNADLVLIKAALTGPPWSALVFSGAVRKLLSPERCCGVKSPDTVANLGMQLDPGSEINTWTVDRALLNYDRLVRGLSEVELANGIQDAAAAKGEEWIDPLQHDVRLAGRAVNDAMRSFSSHESRHERRRRNLQSQPPRLHPDDTTPMPDPETKSAGVLPMHQGDLVGTEPDIQGNEVETL